MKNRAKQTDVMPTALITAIDSKGRYRKDLGDISGLAESISEVGLLHPIVVTPTGRLIAGARRLAALRKLKWTKVPVNIVDLAQVARGEFDENTVRKDFAPTEIAAISAALKPEVKAETPRGRPKKGGNIPPLSKGKTRDKVAKRTGVSARTVTKIEEIVAAAKENPKLYGELPVEMDRTGRVSGVHRKLTKLKDAARIKKEPKPLPTGPFRVIVADPPWRYDKRLNDPSHRASLDYGDMSIEQICKMAVGGMAAKDSILWLWTTNAHMREAFTVLDAWGFEHKTILTWEKDQMSTGDWLRGKTEHCLLAVRGKPTVLSAAETTILHAPRSKHSAKPDEFYALVERMCPGSKVDIFARKKRDGWATFPEMK